MLHTFGVPDLYTAADYGITQEYVDYAANSGLNDIMRINQDPQTGEPNYGPETLVMGIVYNKDEDDLAMDRYVDLRAQRVFYMDEDGRYKAKLLIDPNVSYIYDKLPKALGYSDEERTV